MATVVLIAAVALSLPVGCTAFARVPKSASTGGTPVVSLVRTVEAPALFFLPSHVETDASVLNLAAVGHLVVAKTVSEADWVGLAKSLVVSLAFGGGLIPAALSANKSMFGMLENEAADDYVAESGATGPVLPNSELLFAKERIPLVDIIAIIGRIENLDSIADWRNLPIEYAPGKVDPENPPMWLPRSTFKENIRKARFLGWPTDGEGGPIGGPDLEGNEGPRISELSAEIGDAALDAVFDTWAWGASFATPDKVADQLAQWRADRSTFDLEEFTVAAIRGRAVTGIGALTFVLIQIVAYFTLFIAPLLRVFFDIDIGFGQVGACDPVACTKLF